MIKFKCTQPVTVVGYGQLEAGQTYELAEEHAHAARNFGEVIGGKGYKNAAIGTKETEVDAKKTADKEDKEEKTK